MHLQLEHRDDLGYMATHSTEHSPLHSGSVGAATDREERMKAKLKDDAALLLTAIVCSLGAWLFWHLLGPYGGDVLLILVVVGLLVDNIRLRRKQR